MTKMVKALVQGIVLLGSAFSLGACGAYKAELYAPEGVVGATADVAFFKAQTKPMVAYRGLVIGAALMRMAERNATTPQSALGAVNSANGVIATVERLRQMIRTPCYAGSAPCADNAYSVLFEAKLPDLHESLYYLAASAMPPQKFAEIASSAAGGDYIGALLAALTTAKEALLTAQYGFAVGRSATEQRAVTAGKSPDSTFTVRAAHDFLVEQGDRAGQLPDDVAFFAMYALIKESCLRISARTLANSTMPCGDAYAGQSTAGLYPPTPGKPVK
jgi:hypothetical protein